MANSITISGKIYRPNVKYTQSGVAIFEGGLSVYCGKNKEGEAQYGFINVKAFKEQAENAGNWLKDKDDVIVTGRLTIDIYNDKDNNKKTKYEIIADAIGNNLGRMKRDIVIPGQEDAAQAFGGTEVDPEIPF